LFVNKKKAGASPFVNCLFLSKTSYMFKSLHLQSHAVLPFRAMLPLLSCLRDCFRARLVLQAEILALQHQLLVLQRSSRDRLPKRSDIRTRSRDNVEAEARSFAPKTLHCGQKCGRHRKFERTSFTRRQLSFW
jgi:hypothetical protein